MGYWADYENAYWTMNPDYVESVWWALKQIFDKGLLVEDYRVAPYCPRCGTTLSDHEVAQGYEDVTDPSVYVRFPLTSGPVGRTGRPAGLDDHALDPGVQHRRRGEPGRQLPVVRFRRADAGRRRAAGGRACSARRPRCWPPCLAPKWSGWTLPAPVRPRRRSQDAHYVVLADYVTTEDGTGLVHQAPAFGADDLAVSRAYGLPVVNPIGPDGHFHAGVPLSAASSSRMPTTALVADLRERGLLLRHVPYTHSYPHCWRCHTPLMYYALPSWYVRTTAIKEKLLEENERTNWYPPTIKHGRYGDWLDQQHRLGAVARPVLGHAAAGLAQRRGPGPDDLRRFPGRAA